MTDNGDGDVDLMGVPGARLAVSDAATRAGEMIAGQVRAVVDATRAHARTIVEEAQGDARRIIGEARFEANSVRAQVDAIADLLEGLLRDMQRNTDQVGAILAPERYFGGQILPAPSAGGELAEGPSLPPEAPIAEVEEPESEPEARRGTSATDPPPSAAPTDPEPEKPVAVEPEEPAVREEEPVARVRRREPEHDPEIHRHVPRHRHSEPEIDTDRPSWRRFERTPSSFLQQVGPESAEEWAAAATGHDHEAPCSGCGTTGRCDRCRGRGRRFGLRCGACHGKGRCARCRGNGYVWAVLH